MSLWEAVQRILLILIAVACIIGMICKFVPKYSKYRALQQQKAALEEQRRLAERRIRRFQTQQAQMASDPAFVERTARDLGMVKSNETVCKMTEDVPELIDAHTSPPPRRP